MVHSIHCVNCLAGSLLDLCIVIFRWGKNGVHFSRIFLDNNLQFALMVDDISYVIHNWPHDER